MSRDIRYIIKRIIIGVGIALSIMFIKGNVYAEVIALDSSSSMFGVTLGNDSSFTGFPFSYAHANQYFEIAVHLYNYEGITRPYPYLIFAVCTYGDLNTALVRNTGYNSYFADDGATVYNSNKICANNGTISYVQMQVGKYGDLDGTGEELYASSYLSFRTVDNSIITFNSALLSSDDFITILSSNEEIADKLGDLMVAMGNNFTALGNSFNTYLGNQTNSLLNNATSNANSIINNQNTNTNTIINNQNQNTQDIIDNNNENWNNCENYNYSGRTLFSDLGYLNSRGEVQVNSNLPDIYYTSKYIPLNKNVSYILSVPSQSYYNYCLYDINKNLVSCTNYYNLQTFNINLNYDGFIRYTIDGNTTFTGEYCFNRMDETNKHLDDLNSSINDDNVDSNDPLINDLLHDQSFQDNTGLSSVINAPLSLLNGLTGTCQPINLNLPYFNSQIEIPCMTTAVYSKFPTAFITTIKTIINGFLVYRIIVMLYFLVKDFKDPESDRVEVVDL